MKVIITGSTGMAGEGVLLECLQNNAVTKVLSVSRKSNGIIHAKMEELIISDFNQLADYESDIKDYDACFFCAGISSVGLKEDVYTFITYDTTLTFAKVLQKNNPNMVFCYISGSHTDSTEKGKIMWARVKGKTENALSKMGFRKEYNFRPGIMTPYPGQKKAKKFYVVIARIVAFFSKKWIIPLGDLGKAMIYCVDNQVAKNNLEIKDIKSIANKANHA